MEESAWHPEMLAFQRHYFAAAAKLPAIVLQRPSIPSQVGDGPPA